MRIDKWLWAARFFRTRGLATEMVNGGHVQIDGLRIKPSRMVKIGEEISIRRGDESYVVRVTGLAEKRGSAAVASGLYEETAESMAAREQQAENRRLGAAAGQAGAPPAHAPAERAELIPPAGSAGNRALPHKTLL